MHSLAMARNILDASLSGAVEHGAKRITAILVKADGDFSEADSLLFCLDALSKGTLAEGAHMKIEIDARHTAAGSPGEEPDHVHSTADHGDDKLSVTLELE